jgi:FAD/FMN-containing dehydrogenase
VRGFELVTADGDLISANADENPELFWALRGGKGGFGVVTQLTVELVELATLYGGSLIYAADDIETAYRAWVDYTATADPEVTTSAAVMRVPDFPFVPEPLRGRTLLSIRFAYPGDAATGEQLAAPLRAAAPVYLDGLAEMPAAAIAKIHNDPTEPSVGWTRGRMLASIDADFATALLSQVGPAQQAPFVSVEVRHLGSATARDAAGGSAVGGRTPGYALTLVGAPNPALFETVVPQAADRVIAQLGPWLAEVTNINFLGRCDTVEQFATAWPAETFERLAEIRRRVDPEGMFAYGPR